MITRVALYEASILRSILASPLYGQGPEAENQSGKFHEAVSSPHPKRPGPNLINCGGHSSATKSSQYPGIIWGKFEDFTAQAHAYTEPIKPFKRAICP